MNTTTKQNAAREAGQKLYRLETEYPLAGRDATLTLKEWKRVYGFPEMLLGRGKLVETEAPELHVIGLERTLSDGSIVHSVLIREAGGIPFVELAALDEGHAIKLRREIVCAIAKHTNISTR